MSSLCHLQNIYQPIPLKSNQVKGVEDIYSVAYVVSRRLLIEMLF